jgi:DNA-binding PadR family transcriptional regulator
MTTEEMILDCVSARWKSGRIISQDYERRHGKPLSYGTLYLTLNRALVHGLVERKDDADEDGPAAFFKLSGGTRTQQDAVGLPQPNVLQ